MALSRLSHSRNIYRWDTPNKAVIVDPHQRWGFSEDGINDSHFFASPREIALRWSVATTNKGGPFFTEKRHIKPIKNLEKPIAIRFSIWSSEVYPFNKFARLLPFYCPFPMNISTPIHRVAVGQALGPARRHPLRHLTFITSIIFCNSCVIATTSVVTSAPRLPGFLLRIFSFCGSTHSHGATVPSPHPGNVRVPYHFSYPLSQVDEFKTSSGVDLAKCETIPTRLCLLFEGDDNYTK